MTVKETIAEGLKIRGIKDKDYIKQEVLKVLDKVGLVPEHATRYPHEFSGGQNVSVLPEQLYYIRVNHCR